MGIKTIIMFNNFHTLPSYGYKITFSSYRRCNLTYLFTLSSVPIKFSYGGNNYQSYYSLLVTRFSDDNIKTKLYMPSNLSNVHLISWKQQRKFIFQPNNRFTHILYYNNSKRQFPYYSKTHAIFLTIKLLDSNVLKRKQFKNGTESLSKERSEMCVEFLTNI